jgi:peptidoglycan pentaglycine glycine transferase (the first glycine)
MISNLDKEAWDKKVIELGGSFLQSWAWGEFYEALGYKIHRFSDDNFVCLAIEISLPFGKKYLYCPRGPVGDEKEALVDLKRLSVDRDLVFARVEPLRPMDLPKSVKEVQPSINWSLNLDKTEEELLIEMKPKTRYNINLGKRKGVVVREGDKKDLIILWQLLLETAKRNQIRLHPQNYYFQMQESMPNNLKILVAEHQGKILAGMILIFFGDTATFAHGGSGSQMKEAMAPYVLHWEAIKLAKNAGMKTYDFGGIAQASDEKSSWAGISRFKKGFGGFEVVYPGSFDLIYSPIWYTMYAQGRKLTRILRNKNAV